MMKKTQLIVALAAATGASGAFAFAYDSTTDQPVGTEIGYPPHRVHAYTGVSFQETGGRA